jgi:transcriptional regulator with GAF, ATPase, and Fis domain
MEIEHIKSVLQLCNGKISGPGGAAEILRLPYSTLISKIKKLGIKTEKYFR